MKTTIWAIIGRSSEYAEFECRGAYWTREEAWDRMNELHASLAADTPNAQKWMKVVEVVLPER